MQFETYKTKLQENNTRVEEKKYSIDAFFRKTVNFVQENHYYLFLLYLACNASQEPLKAI